MIFILVFTKCFDYIILNKKLKYYYYYYYLSNKKKLQLLNLLLNPNLFTLKLFEYIPLNTFKLTLYNVT